MSIDDRRKLLMLIGGAAAVPSEAQEANVQQPKERVLGIGGLFFRSHDPDELARWYRIHLGIELAPKAHGKPVWQQSAGPTVFCPFPMGTKYFGSPQQAWIVNFRVRSLDAMVAQLRASNVAVEVDREKYPNGRFARLHDPEGNPIELWEPAGAS